MLKAIKSNISIVLQQCLIRMAPHVYKQKYLKHYIYSSWQNYNPNKIEFEMLLLPYFLNHDSVFFDIGSNIGAFTLIANKTISQNQIYAFEPIPELNKRLSILFPDAHIIPIALSDKESLSSFKIPKINHSHLLTRGTLNTNFVEENEQDKKLITIQTQALDKFVEENKIGKIDVMKIDVEGHEHQVIKGALQTLAKKQPVLIIEIEQRHHTMDILVIINDVVQLGYKCLFFDNSIFQLAELPNQISSLQNKNHFEKSRKYIHNFIFIPQRLIDENYLDEINQKITADRLV